MKVNLFTTYYEDKEREAELFHVHLLNKSANYIDKVYILNEIPLKHEVDGGEKNVVVRYITTRPTFTEIFDWVNEVTEPDNINIVANSDIYFDETGIEIMKLVLTENDCWALTRWDVRSHNMIRKGNVMVKDAVFMNRRDSQDTWVFKGCVKPGDYSVEIGRPGVDNSLAHRLQQAGYNIRNPSWTVKTYHLHAATHRNWHGTAQVSPPYLLLTPEEL